MEAFDLIVDDSGKEMNISTVVGESGVDKEMENANKSSITTLGAIYS